MSVKVHVTAWPNTSTVTVDVNGELDAGAASDLSALLSRLHSDLVGTLVVDLARATVADRVPRALLVAMRPSPTDSAVRHIIINVPTGVAPPSACAAPQLLWHERGPHPVAWPEAVRHARSATTGASCDCDPSGSAGCTSCGDGCTADRAPRHWTR